MWGAGLLPGRSWPALEWSTQGLSCCCSFLGSECGPLHHFWNRFPVGPWSSVTGCQTRKAPPASLTSVVNCTCFFFFSLTFSENPKGPVWWLGGRAEGGRKLARSPPFGSRSLGPQPSAQQLAFRRQEKVLLMWPRGTARLACEGSAESSSLGSDEKSCSLAGKAFCFYLGACLFSHYRGLQRCVCFCLLWDRCGI